MGQNDNVISCKNVRKVFGDHPERLTGHLKPETTSEELRVTGHVAAVHNVSLDIARGGMLVVMGLSGSGKSSLILSFPG